MLKVKQNAEEMLEIVSNQIVVIEKALLSLENSLGKSGSDGEGAFTKEEVRKLQKDERL